MPLKSNSFKSEMRSDLLQQLKQISTDQQNEWSRAIQKNLSQVLANQSGEWGAFYPLGNEPQFEWVSVSSAIQWCFPEVVAERLQFKRNAKNFRRSTLGVSEPVDGEVIDLADLRGVIVPGLAFSAKGHRLGRGKGFYDRALASYQGKKVGVCYGISFKQEIPTESHDVLFHQIITENSAHQVENVEGDPQWN